MPQIFHRAANTWSKISIAAALVLLSLSGWLGLKIARSSYVTQALVVRDQPVPFSHKHHVQQVGLDCRYCHWPVERSRFAGIPATEVCMGCHAQIWSDSPMLAPVRDSLRQNKPLAWTRVHDLPDFTYFDHSIHVARGIGCADCHGRVDEMPLVWRQATLHMDWCLDCHRHPGIHVRPRDEVFAMDWTRDDNRAVASDEIDSPVTLSNCSICHR